MAVLYDFVKEVFDRNKKDKKNVSFDAGPFIGVFNPSTLKTTIEAIGNLFSSDFLDSITSGFGTIKAEVFQKQQEIIETIHNAEALSNKLKLKQDEYYSKFMVGLNSRISELLNGILKDLSDSVIDKLYDEIGKLGEHLPQDWQNAIDDASKILTGKNPQLYVFYKIAALVETGGMEFYLALLSRTRDSLKRELIVVRDFNKLILAVNKDIDAILGAKFAYKSKRVDIQHLEQIRRMMIEISGSIANVIENHTLGAGDYRDIESNLDRSIALLVNKVSILKGRQTVNIYDTGADGNPRIDYTRLIPDDIKQAIDIAEQFIVKIQQINGSKISSYLLSMCRVCYYSSLINNYEDIIFNLSKKSSYTIALFDKMEIMRKQVDKVAVDITALRNSNQKNIDSNIWMGKNVKYLREISNIKDYFDRFIAPYKESSIFDSPVGNKLSDEGEEFVRLVKAINRSAANGVLYKIGYRSSHEAVSTRVHIDPRFSMIYEIFDYMSFWVGVTSSTVNMGSIFKKGVAEGYREDMIEFKEKLLYNITEIDRLIISLENFPRYKSKELDYVIKQLNKLGYKHAIDFIMSGQLVELMNYGISAAKMGIGAVGKLFNQDWSFDFELNDGMTNWVSEKSSNAFYHNEGFVDAMVTTNKVFDNVINRSVLKDTVSYNIDQVTSEYSQYVASKIGEDEKREEDQNNSDKIFDYESD